MKSTALASILAALLASGAAAQDAAGISLELNRAVDTEGGNCQVAFFGQNGTDQDYSEMTWRLAVFGADGVFQNLLALPLGALSAGKRRIVQYNLPNACDSLSEIIVNEVGTCTLADGSDSDACLTNLTVSSRAAIAFGL